MYNFSGNQAAHPYLHFHLNTSNIKPPFECLIVISSLSLIMASDITFKCQNLFPLPISLYQNMVALLFQLFRLKTHGYRFACMSGDEQDPFSDEEPQEGK